MSAAAVDITRPASLQPTAEPKWANHYRCGSLPAWRVVQTHPQAERWARDNLNRQGYVTYLPMHFVWQRDRVLRSVRIRVERPLFTSYLFIQLSDNEPKFPVRSTYGVSRLLTDPVRGGAVEALQAGDAIRAVYQPPSASWAPGAAVRLADGPLHGQDAVVLSAGHDMALVALMLFGHLREISVALNCLVPRDD